MAFFRQPIFRTVKSAGGFGGRIVFCSFLKERARCPKFHFISRLRIVGSSVKPRFALADSNWIHNFDLLPISPQHQDQDAVALLTNF